MVASIEQAKPPLLVTLNDRLGYFTASPAYYFILRDYVQRNYVLVRRIGRYDVLARRELLDTHPELAAARVSRATCSTAPSRTASTRASSPTRAASPRAGRRATSPARRRGSPTSTGACVRRPRRRSTPSRRATRAATRRSSSVLATSRSARLLYLRTLGEYGAPASLGYLQDVFLSSDGRIRWEAARSINFLLARELSARFTLIAPAAGSAGAAARHARRATRWWRRSATTSPSASASDRSRRWRSRSAGRSDLTAKIDGPWDRRETTWWKMLAAYALVQLGDTDRLPTLFELMNEGTLPGQFVPSIVLDPDVVPPTTRRSRWSSSGCRTAASRSARPRRGWCRSSPADGAWPAVEAAAAGPGSARAACGALGARRRTTRRKTSARRRRDRERRANDGRRRGGGGGTRLGVAGARRRTPASGSPRRTRASRPTWRAISPRTT